MLNEEKRFCFGVDELESFVEKDEELNALIGKDLAEIGADVFLRLLRNCPFILARGNFEMTTFLIDKLSGFQREEFRFLRGDKNLCAEGQLKGLLSEVFVELHLEAKRKNLNLWEHSVLLESWRRWFVSFSDTKVDDLNEVYETYNFEVSENVIMHIVGLLHLPPLQEQYVKYYLGLKGGIEVDFTDFEMDILMKAGKNILLQEPKVCKMLDELLKS